LLYAKREKSVFNGAKSGEIAKKTLTKQKVPKKFFGGLFDKNRTSSFGTLFLTKLL
jgi:hypothetical protein